MWQENKAWLITYHFLLTLLLRVSKAVTCLLSLNSVFLLISLSLPNLTRLHLSSFYVWHLIKDNLLSVWKELCKLFLRDGCVDSYLMIYGIFTFLLFYPPHYMKQYVFFVPFIRGCAVLFWIIMLIIFQFQHVNVSVRILLNKTEFCSSTEEWILHVY